MYKITARIYGKDGHRQALSFGKSAVYNWSNDRDGKRVIELLCADRTGTNDYVIMSITRNNKEECYQELDGQITDGFFENCRVGKVRFVRV